MKSRKRIRRKLDNIDEEKNVIMIAIIKTNIRLSVGEKKSQKKRKNKEDKKTELEKGIITESQMFTLNKFPFYLLTESS